MDAVGEYTKGDVVFLGVERQAEVDGTGECVAVEVDKVDVAATKALPSVGGEKEGVAVGMDEGALLVAGCIDGGAEIDGTPPGAVGFAAAAPDVGTAESTFAVGGEVEGVAVGGDGGLGVPAIGAIDAVSEVGDGSPA